MDTQYIIYTDAGSRGNPGPAAASAILLDQNEKLIDIDGRYLGETTNNIAEYEGLIIGLSLAISHSCTRVTCIMDSELVVKQIRGEYKIKNEALQKKHAHVMDMLKRFSSLSFEHVPRKKNAIADKLVNIILDSHSAYGNTSS